MVNIETLVRQLSESGYKSILNSFKSENDTLLLGIIIIYRTESFNDIEICDTLQIPEECLPELNRLLRRKIYTYLGIDCNESRHQLLNRVSYQTQKSDSISTKEDQNVLLALLSELKKNNITYESTPLYKRLVDINKDHSDFEKYLQLYNKHLDMMNVSERSLLLLTHLNTKIGEYYQEKCTEYLSQIEQTFLEIQKTYIQQDNLITEAAFQLSSLSISLFVEESIYAAKGLNEIENSYIETVKAISAMPAEPEQLYGLNILKICSIKLNNILTTTHPLKALCSKFIETINQKESYDFNFPNEIKTELITSTKRSAKKNQEGIIIPIQGKIGKSTPVFGIYNNLPKISNWIYKSTAYS